MAARREPWVGRILGRLALLSAASPKRVVAVLAVLTLVVGGGMTQLATDSDLLKILPKDDPHTHAAQNASREFRGFYDFVEFFYEIDPEKCAAVSEAKLPHRLSEPTCDDVTDEVYVRGMEEFWQFMQERLPHAEYAIDLAGIVKTVNWTNSGIAQDDPQAGVLAPILSGEPDQAGQPRDAAYSMPGTDPVGALQYEGAWRGANAADDSVNDVIGPTKQAGRTIIFFNTTGADVSRVELGRQAFAAADAYSAAVAACDDGDATTSCELSWNVFTDDDVSLRGRATLDAHATDVTQKDISKLAPLIIWSIIVILHVAFRDIRVILVSAVNLFTAFVWTAGLMGWLEIPFSALNMTIVPLILGVGIDYGIHMVSEFLEHKSDGASNEMAFEQAGHRAGLAMAIATVTTMAGLLLMVFSPSVLMGQLGIVASMALGVTFLFTMTLVPAVLTLTAKDSTRRKQKGSRWIVGLARTVGDNRVVAVAVVVMVTAGALLSVQDLEPEPFGNPELNYPEGDRVRDDADRIIDLFFGGDAGTQSNYLIIETDFTRPEVHTFLDALTENLEEHPDIQGFNTASVTRIVRAWKAIEQGTADALVNQFVLGNVPAEEVQDVEYPQTQEEIEQTFDDIFASPFANFMTILLSPDGYRIGMVPFDTSQDLSFAEVQRVWAATESVIAQTKAETGVHDVDVHLFGNNAFSYLFITEQQPWVNTIGIVSYILVVAMIGALTRNLRATACTAVVMAVTAVWWLGLLPLMGIGLSVGLMLPMIFIMAIGTDDAVHLIWNIEQTRDRNKVYRFVGKAVLLTTVTTSIAFAIFSRQTDLLVTRTLMATAAAVLVMWAATMLVVPLFYPPRPESRPMDPGTRPARPRTTKIPPRTQHDPVLDPKTPPLRQVTAKNELKGKQEKKATEGVVISVPAVFWRVSVFPPGDWRLRATPSILVFDGPLGVPHAADCETSWTPQAAAPPCWNGYGCSWPDSVPASSLDSWASAAASSWSRSSTTSWASPGMMPSPSASSSSPSRHRSVSACTPGAAPWTARCSCPWSWVAPPAWHSASTWNPASASRS